MATGAWVSLDTRMLTRTINCPVLLRTAVCSIAHSSGASRLALVHRTSQPDGGEAGAAVGAASTVGTVVGAARGAFFDLGACWAWLAPMEPKARMAARTASFAETFTVCGSKTRLLRKQRGWSQSQVIRRLPWPSGARSPAARLRYVSSVPSPKKHSRAGRDRDTP